jgi:tetratricopeptide (TPR) repeat protein
MNELTTQQLHIQEIDKIFTEMHKLIYEHKYKEAIDLCHKAITITKNEKNKERLNEGYFHLGISYNELRQYQQAVDAYKQAIKIEPNHHVTYNNMGVSYIGLEEYQQTIKACQNTIKINPNYTKAYHNIGIAYSKLEQYQKAIDAYKKAIEIEPNYHKVYMDMSFAYNKLGKYQKVIDTYKKAIEIKSDDYVAYNDMGNAYSQLEQYQKAIVAYKKAIKIKPDCHDARINILEAQSMINKNLFQKSAQLDGELEIIMLAMLKILKQIKDDTISQYWQEEFSSKYSKGNFANQPWKEIKTWIENKENENNKPELQSALKFFKSFNQ